MNVKFKLRTLLLIVAIGAITTSTVKWLRCNTILHADLDTYVTLPNRHRIPTNRWFRTDELRSFSFLSSGDRLLIIQGSSGKVASILVGNKNVVAVVAKYRIDGPTYRAEYWITPDQSSELDLSE